MNWIELLIFGSLIVIVIAIVRSKKRTGRSCCSEGMDDEGYDINRKESQDKGAL